jgi:hypothetical protein
MLPTADQPTPECSGPRSPGTLGRRGAFRYPDLARARLHRRLGFSASTRKGERESGLNGSGRDLIAYFWMVGGS